MRRVKERWRAARDELRVGLIPRDDVDFAVHASDPAPNPNPKPTPNPNPNPKRPLRLVAGVDVSYRREFIYDSTHGSETAVACLAVLRFPELTPEWVDFEEFTVDAPYVPGFLAFRESPAMTTLLRRCPPGAEPDVVLVDGNGALHPGVRPGVPRRRRVRGSDGWRRERPTRLTGWTSRQRQRRQQRRRLRREEDGKDRAFRKAFRRRIPAGGYPALWPDAVALVGASGKAPQARLCSVTDTRGTARGARFTSVAVTGSPSPPRWRWRARAGHRGARRRSRSGWRTRGLARA